MVSLVIGDWQFRMLSSGVIECKNAKKRLDWQARTAAEVGLASDQWYVPMQSMLVQLHQMSVSMIGIPRPEEAKQTTQNPAAVL